MNAKKRLVLIDGNSMLTSAFFGTTMDKSWFRGDKETAREKMMKTSDGQFTNAIFGMTKTLLKLFKEQPSTHFAVAWDVSRHTHRRERFADYKAHRKDTENELGSQFKPMRELLDSMGITQYSIEGWEADDIIGTLAKRFESQIAVVVITKDQDALQLVSEGTRVWLNTSTAADKVRDYFGDNFDAKYYNAPKNYFEFTTETFPYFYGGLTPEQMIDFKGLAGDASDNIPGVKGCGEASIYPLLNELDTVEAIYDYLENHSEKEIKAFFKEIGIKRSPLKSLLKEPTFEGEICGKEAATLSKELATIETEMSQFNETELKELEFILNEDAMYAQFEKLEFNSLIKKK